MVIYYTLYQCLKDRLAVPILLVEESVNKQTEISKKYAGDDKNCTRKQDQLQKLMKQKYNDYVSRFPCLLHSFSTAQPVYIYWHYHEFKMMENVEDIFVETALLSISHAYFLFDTQLMLVGETPWDWLNIVHHVVTFGCIGPGYFYQIYVRESIALLGFAECSAVFLHLRFIFDHHKSSGPIVTINSIVFCVVFIYVRIYRSYIMLSPIQYGPHHFFFKVQIMVIYYISFFWLWQILNLFPKKLVELSPGNPVFKAWYNVMKQMRSLEVVWYVGTFIFTTRLTVTDYLGKYGYI